MQIINHSALESFRASVDIVAGKADLELVGDGLRFDEQVYPIVANDPDIAAATPIVEDVASLTDYPGEYLQLLGVDIFSNEPLRTFELHDAQDQKPDVVGFLRDPKVIALTRKLSQRLGLKIGDPLRLETQTGIETFHIGYILDFGEDAPGADEHLSVMDIANVQENFRHIGQAQPHLRARSGPAPISTPSSPACARSCPPTSSSRRPTAATARSSE